MKCEICETWVPVDGTLPWYTLCDRCSEYSDLLTELRIACNEGEHGLDLWRYDRRPEWREYMQPSGAVCVVCGGVSYDPPQPDSNYYCTQACLDAWMAEARCV